MHTVSFQASMSFQLFVIEGVNSEFLCKELMFSAVSKYIYIAFCFQQCLFSCTISLMECPLMNFLFSVRMLGVHIFKNIFKSGES